MVEIRKLATPKVAIPIFGIIVLIVVSTLVAMFYIRNPTVTDNLFGGSGEESSTPRAGEMKILENSNQNSSVGSSMQTTTSASHDQSAITTHGTSPVPVAVTTPPGQASTPMHAIEPVQHV